jgi:hypothetical protein
MCLEKKKSSYYHENCLLACIVPIYSDTKIVALLLARYISIGETNYPLAGLFFHHNSSGQVIHDGFRAPLALLPCSLVL